MADGPAPEKTMHKLRIGVGLTVGLLTAALCAVLAFERFMGDCFFEQGCGASENPGLVGILVLASMAGLCAGWASVGLLKLIAKQRV